MRMDNFGTLLPYCIRKRMTLQGEEIQHPPTRTPVRAQGMPTSRDVINGETLPTRNHSIPTRWFQCWIGGKRTDLVPQTNQGLDQSDEQRGPFHLAWEMTCISIQQMLDVGSAQRTSDPYAHGFIPAWSTRRNAIVLCADYS